MRSTLAEEPDAISESEFYGAFLFAMSVGFTKLVVKDVIDGFKDGALAGAA
jgi:hypothetical protein